MNILLGGIILFDSHIHTNFSTDSKMNIEEAIKVSKKSGINLIITEHMDLKYPKEKLFVFNPEEYFNSFRKYRNEELLLGIELGMRDDCITESHDIEKNYDFDFVLGSIHLVDNIDIFYEDLYENKTKNEVYNQYLRCMNDCIKSYDFIDSLGHIDYIARYAPYDDKEIYYTEFSDLIDLVLKNLASMEKSIEINTRRFPNKDAVNNLKRIYGRFKELGGKTVTIGSDSHKPEVIGHCISDARELADICGLKVVYYKNRKPNYDE